MYRLIQLTQNKIARIAAVIAVTFSLAPTIALGVVEVGNGVACDATHICAAGLICGGSGKCEAQDYGLGKTGTGLQGSLGNKGLIETVTAIINVALSLLGLVAVVIVLIGGFKWMTAGGNEEQVTEGRKYITSGIIGIAIILSAFAITRFVIANLSRATGSGTVTEPAAPAQ